MLAWTLLFEISPSGFHIAVSWRGGIPYDFWQLVTSREEVVKVNACIHCRYSRAIRPWSEDAVVSFR